MSLLHFIFVTEKVRFFKKNVMFFPDSGYNEVIDRGCGTFVEVGVWLRRIELKRIKKYLWGYIDIILSLGLCVYSQRFPGRDPM